MTHTPCLFCNKLTSAMTHGSDNFFINYCEHHLKDGSRLMIGYLGQINNNNNNNNANEVIGQFYIRTIVYQVYGKKINTKYTMVPHGSASLIYTSYISPLNYNVLLMGPHPTMVKMDYPSGLYLLDNYQEGVYSNPKYLVANKNRLYTSPIEDTIDNVNNLKIFL